MWVVGFVGCRLFVCWVLMGDCWCAKFVVLIGGECLCGGLCCAFLCGWCVLCFFGLVGCFDWFMFCCLVFGLWSFIVAFFIIAVLVGVYLGWVLGVVSSLCGVLLVWWW